MKVVPTCCVEAIKRRYPGQGGGGQEQASVCEPTSRPGTPLHRELKLAAYNSGAGLEEALSSTIRAPAPPSTRRAWQ